MTNSTPVLSKPVRERKIPIEYDQDNTWHVYPHAEEKMHQLVGLECPCNPKIEKQPNDGMVVTHNRTYTKGD